MPRLLVFRKKLPYFIWFTHIWVLTLIDRLRDIKAETKSLMLKEKIRG